MRIAVIGCGSIGRRRLAILRELGVNNLLAYDPDSATQEKLMADGYYPAGGIKRFGEVLCRTFTDLWAQQPDVVFVCTPPRDHVEIAIEAAERGCHLFIEKPLSDCMGSYKGGLRIGYLDLLCQRQNLVAMVGCNMRYHDGVKAIKHWIEHGQIGEVLYGRFHTGSWLPDWVPGRDYRTAYTANTGVLLDVGSHEVDVALHLLGPAKLASAVVRPATSIGLACDGLAELLLEHESGAVSSVHLNFVQRDYDRSIKVVGTEGTAYWEWSENKAWLWDGDKYPLAHVDGWRNEWMYEEEMKAFLTAVRAGGPSPNDLRGAAKTLALLLAARGDGKKPQMNADERR